MNRRNFLKSSLVISGVSITGSMALLESCAKDSTSIPQGPSVNFTLDLSNQSNATLKSSGGSISSHGVIVINQGGNYIAVAQRCTHQGCTVAYNNGSKHLVCPCHGGTFDLTGNVVSGPPPAPLKTYTVTQNGNILTISG